MNKETDINKFIKPISIIAFCTGLVYGFILLGKNIFLGYEIKTTEVQILAVLLATGLLGSILNFILRKLVKEFVADYLTKDTIKPIIEDELERSQVLAKEESEKNMIEEGQSDDFLNTVIVPVQNSINYVISNLKYECPASYKFKEGLEYIAFYKEKKVIGYGKLKSRTQYNVNQNGKKVFDIERYVPTEIPHEKKGAFIQNKMYCNIDKLITAKTTADIR